MKYLAALLSLIVLFTLLTAESGHSMDRKDRYNRRKAPRLEPRLVHANNAFAIRLFKQVDGKAGDANTFLSPYSITTALALLYNGAGGDTRDAMARALDFQGYSFEQINQSAAALRDVLEAPESGIRVRMANGLWIKNGREFRDDFLVRVGRFFRADATEVDFGAPGAADEINDWVADKTGDKIDYLFADEDVARAEAVLANAVWFRGRWQRGFDPSYTQDGPFTPESGSSLKLPMMRRTHAFAYFRGDGVTGVTVPYGKGNLSFYALLPDEGTPVKDVVAHLEPGRWHDWMSRLRPHSDAVTLTLPRFKVTEEVVLNQPLSAMGMGAAFARRADFRPMGLEGAGLHVMKHKAALEIAESGSPAPPMKVDSHDEVERISINRPFLCGIRDNRTGAILFLGAIRNPK